MGISFQKIPLRGSDFQGFSCELNLLIRETIDIAVKELKTRFGMISNTQHISIQRAEIIDVPQSFDMIHAQTTFTLLEKIKLTHCQNGIKAYC